MAELSVETQNADESTSNGITLSLDGTTIKGNCGKYAASAVLLGHPDATVTLKDVTIEDNVGNDGAVTVQIGTLAVLGPTTIDGNHLGDGTTPCNLCLHNGAMLSVAGPLTGKIGVSTDGKGVFTSDLSNNGGLSNFTSEMGQIYNMTLTQEGEAQFELADGILTIPAHGSDTYDMTSAKVGDKVTVYDEGGTNDYGSNWDGTVSVDKTSTWEGKLVTITTSPDAGYLLSGITVNGEPITTDPYSDLHLYHAGAGRHRARDLWGGPRDWGL